MKVTLLGISIDVSFEQPKNAKSDIEITVSDSVILQGVE